MFQPLFPHLFPNMYTARFKGLSVNGVYQKQSEITKAECSSITTLMHSASIF